MRLLSDQLPRPQPPAVLTIAALRQIQLQLAALVEPVAGEADVPLSRAAGRVLARDLHAASGPERPLLAGGTRLAARHLPLFANCGRTLAPVLARARIGVIALAGDAGDVDAAARPRRAGAGASAAWVAATLERLGAQPFEAVCRGADPQRFLGTLEMFIGGCDLVITTGFLSPSLCEAVRDAQRRRGQPDVVETLRLRPLGALQLMQVGSTLVVALSADLESSVGAFTTLLTPLICRLQGRADPLPDVRAAELDDSRRCDDARWRLLPVHVDPDASNARVLLKPCAHGDAALTLAAADGLAWHAGEFASFDRPTVGYFGFDAWAG